MTRASVFASISISWNIYLLCVFFAEACCQMSLLSSRVSRCLVCAVVRVCWCMRVSSMYAKHTLHKQPRVCDRSRFVVNLAPAASTWECVLIAWQCELGTSPMITEFDLILPVISSFITIDAPCVFPPPRRRFVSLLYNNNVNGRALTSVPYWMSASYINKRVLKTYCDILLALFGDKIEDVLAPLLS